MPALNREARMYQMTPLAQQHAASLSRNHRVIEVNADFDRYGAWAGVSELVRLAYLDLLARQRHDILEEHNHALYMVLLDYRSVITLKYACLTETARGSERTRNFALDRAYRFVHSLVTLLSQWKAICAPGEQWAVVVRDLDRAQHLGKRFFVELARRLTERDQISVFACAAPGWSEAMAATGLALLAVDEDVSGVTMEKPPAPPESPVAASAAGIERDGMQEDMNAWEKNYVGLLQEHSARGDALAVAEAALRTLCMYNHYGYYYEASTFADRVMPHLNALAGDDQEALWNYVGNTAQSLITTGREERALQLILETAMPALTRSELLAKVNYMLSMMHLRYLPHKDIDLADQYIVAALGHLEGARGEMPPHEFTFLNVFLNNGLAFVRVRQGRKREAGDLCRAGFEVLTREVGAQGHRLHRSVLLYNTAQVHVSLGEVEQALEYYRDVIQMDPYYSEYYNEIANILQQQGKFAEAIPAYDLAIKYSAPYPEVYSNKGICQSQLEQWEAAFDSLSMSTELNPDQPDLHLLRAEILEQLGRNAEAIALYDRLIGQANAPVTARVNRAVLHYQDGNFDKALADMNAVIAAEPTNASHYENRSAIFAAMNQAAMEQADTLAAQRYREAA